jgi:hypothetical protein
MSAALASVVIAISAGVKNKPDVHIMANSKKGKIMAFLMQLQIIIIYIQIFLGQKY